MDGPLRHPDELEQFLRALGPGRRPLPCQAHRQLDVLLGGQRGDEVEELEDETDLLQAIPNELGIAEVDQVRPFTSIRPAVGRSIPPSRFKRVVFPQPDGPRTATGSRSETAM